MAVQAEVTSAVATILERQPRSRRRIRLRPNLVIGGFLVLLLILGATFAPVLSLYPPDQMKPAIRLQPPSLAHPFGTDIFGRDMYSRILYGSRIALRMSILSVLLAAIPGVWMGLLAGYHRGWGERVLSRIMDAWMAFPGLLLAIVFVARLGPSLNTTVIALGVVGIPSFYRMARSGTISTSHMLYVEAARASGLGSTRILLRHILPNLASPLIVLLTMRIGTMLLAAGGLSFIGLGAQPPLPEWGALLAAGRDHLDTAWWLALAPGMAFTLSVMGFNLLGDGLRDLLARE
ncbi:binding-protein-dependent transport systems inner membrane component [Oscillochloris trichoides DG-6]|uniref:Binding-protein-dependent transport systems inner membrane component n=1 Tax=Oscillochloris trichoides DG-6 TaxID=765420 RepID=E1IER9_9CHLR|nr:ABC transporter permease [Oscillochloris trichoides]EFO80318.1 binding-protein-dependent transport systems inner membrane component [Oscillochloris trichoides DG-6]